MRIRTLLQAVVLGTGLAAACAHATEESVDLEYGGFGQARAHRLGPEPVVRLHWADLTQLSAGDRWGFRLIVDIDGSVAKAVPISRKKSPAAAQALQLAKALKFKPFERDGRAVSVTFDDYIDGLAQDCVDPSDRVFPSSPDPKQVRIALRRTALFGQRYAEKAKALVLLDCDVNAQDLQGRTPVQATTDESVVAVLLEAGAKLPSDRQRPADLIARARDQKWIRLLSVFTKAAGDGGSAPPAPQ